MVPATPITEESIRPASLMRDKEAALESDVRYLLERRDQWVEAGCPSCGGRHRVLFGRKNGFSYQRCTACETVFTSPRPSPKLLDAFYAQSANYAYWNEHVFPATESTRRSRIFRPRAERLKAMLGDLGKQPGTLLDVGAAFGTFCLEAMDTGLAAEAIALEPTPGLAETCRRRALRVIESPLEHVRDERVADIVTAFEVIEHVFDPEGFVRACARQLRPGGLLVLSCPNVKGFAIDELGVASGSFDHEHLNYFHAASLRALVNRCGLQTLETLTPGELDVDIVRKAALSGDLDLAEQPMIRGVLLEDDEPRRAAFQRFLAERGMSSHLWLVAEKTSDPTNAR
ncbi:MAG: class I SAM-dependent methyltransferase [Planctomycetota bacterium]